MDRRRYVPPSLGGGPIELEKRQLLTSSVNSLFGGIFSMNPLPDQPPTIPLRRQRIKNLPFILQSYEPTRALPPSVMAPIQHDLSALISLIHNPGQKVLLQFNRVIRDISPTKHFSPAQAEKLIHAFDIVLNGSGTNPALRKKFDADMTALARIDAGGPEPMFQLSNDFAIIAQLTQSIGQPLPAPPPPAMLGAENIGKHGANITIYHRPTFVGSATPDLEIVLALGNGGIIATGLVNRVGQYTVKTGFPLPDGLYKVKAYTYNEGYNSLQSGPYILRVTTPPALKARLDAAGTPPTAVPRGPLG